MEAGEGAVGVELGVDLVGGVVPVEPSAWLVAVLRIDPGAEAFLVLLVDEVDGIGPLGPSAGGWFLMLWPWCVAVEVVAEDGAGGIVFMVFTEGSWDKGFVGMVTDLREGGDLQVLAASVEDGLVGGIGQVFDGFFHDVEVVLAAWWHYPGVGIVNGGV